MRGIVQEFVWQMDVLSPLMFGIPLKSNAISCYLWMNEQMIVFYWIFFEKSYTKLIFFSV